MPLPAVPSLLPSVCAIARDAGGAIMRHYTSDVGVTTKSDGSPVTQADQAAEDLILPALGRLTPEIPIVSEEAFAAGNAPSSGAGTFWLVDPLDGTREFISRNGEFTVNIALIVDRTPVLGVIYCPALDELYAGVVPDGAWRTLPGRAEEPIAVRAMPADGLTVVESRSHGDIGRLDGFLAGRTVRERLRVGSSLKFCRVAAGEADLYARFGNSTMEWDTAAGHAILVAAGGSVTTEDANPLTYGKAGYANPGFIARGKA